MSFGKERPKRTPETIKWADVIVIPSDSEFRYHGELQMNPKDLAKSESHMEKIRPYFEGKRVIIFRSDRGDTKELYENETFKGVKLKSIDVIDETDFSGNIHGMKYHFIQTLKNPLAEMMSDGKTKDFGYWGRMKPSEKNVREKTIRQIYRSDLSTVLVGGFPSGVERQSKWIKDWKILLPMLEPCRATLCFNWLDPTATTSRYPEALSIGMIPFVWGDYDKNNTYNIDDWQRVNTFEDLEHRIKQLRNDALHTMKLTEYRNNYKKVLLSEDEYFKLFSIKMDVFVNST